jgi:hypothetical protein
MPAGIHFSDQRRGTLTLSSSTGRGITGHEKPYEGATNVWLTPKDMIDDLGPFDLDPCAADLGGQLKSHTWGHFKTAHYPVGTSKPHT